MKLPEQLGQVLVVAAGHVGPRRSAVVVDGVGSAVGMRAALIYQHATDEADRRPAERLSGLVDEQRGPRPNDDEGPTGALVPVS